MFNSSEKTLNRLPRAGNSTDLQYDYTMWLHVSFLLHVKYTISYRLLPIPNNGYRNFISTDETCRLIRQVATPALGGGESLAFFRDASSSSDAYFCRAIHK